MRNNVLTITHQLVFEYAEASKEVDGVEQDAVGAPCCRAVLHANLNLWNAHLNVWLLFVVFSAAHVKVYCCCNKKQNKNKTKLFIAGNMTTSVACPLHWRATKVRGECSTQTRLSHEWHVTVARSPCFFATNSHTRGRPVSYFLFFSFFFVFLFLGGVGHIRLQYRNLLKTAARSATRRTPSHNGNESSASKGGQRVPKPSTSSSVL